MYTIWVHGALGYGIRRKPPRPPSQVPARSSEVLPAVARDGPAKNARCRRVEGDVQGGTYSDSSDIHSNNSSNINSIIVVYQ